MMMTKTVAILGGSFNPPTNAHTMIAKNLLNEPDLKLDEVWFMPALQHPFSKKMIPYENRLALCKLATNNTQIKTSNFEDLIAASGSRWPAGSTMKLAMHLINAHNNTIFKFIIGMDCALEFHKWKHHEELQDRITFIIIPRPGYPHDPNAWYMQGKSRKHNYLPHINVGDLSSSKIRQELRAWTNREKPTEFLSNNLNPNVLNYIRNKSLYTASKLAATGRPF